MGMFDTIRCAYPLPDPENQDLEFQTKSLDCTLDEYLITADRCLLRKCVERVWGKDPFRVSIVPGSERWEPVPFDSDIYFYPSAEGELVVYRARFEEGELLGIKRARASFGEMTLAPE